MVFQNSLHGNHQQILQLKFPILNLQRAFLGEKSIREQSGSWGRTMTAPTPISIPQSPTAATFCFCYRGGAHRGWALQHSGLMQLSYCSLMRYCSLGGQAVLPDLGKCQMKHISLTHLLRGLRACTLFVGGSKQARRQLLWLC